MKAKTYYTLFVLIATLSLSVGCATDYKYNIGVSQFNVILLIYYK